MKTWQPLRGVRVLSFELAFALPAGTRALHDLGADVVRVSPPARQVDRYVGLIDGVFHGKSSLSIDLTQAQGRELAGKLAGAADVVCSNFRPHVLTKYGLGATELREANPRLITLQLSGYGTPGPWANYPAFGPSTEAAGGLNRLLVNEDEVPLRIGSAVFSDQLAGRYAALSIVDALRERQETGCGQALDLSMAAGISHMLGQPMTAAYRTGQVPKNLGNRDPRFVPQGVYRAAVDKSSGSTGTNDEWVAVSVVSDQQWQALHSLLAALPAALDLKLPVQDATREQRWAQHDVIDELLQVFCATADKNAVARQLQDAGVPAVAVRDVADQALDPNVRSRESLPLVRHAKPVLGYAAHPHAVLPWRLAGRSLRALGDYRHTGIDNASVLQKWLAMPTEEIRRLERSEVLWREAPLNIKPRRPARHHDPEHGARLGLPE